VPRIFNRDPGNPKRGLTSGESDGLQSKGLRFFFFAREEERMHVHVLGEEGEAKVWIEPRIELARNAGLSARTLAIAPDLITEREDGIRRAWNEHFGG
jgi:hypothetical protein